LNSMIQIPTITGFPLIIDLNGTLVAAIKAYLNYDTEMIETQLMPSLAVEISTGIHLYAANSRPGITFTSRISSTPVIDNMAEIKDNRIFNAQIRLPMEKQILFKFSLLCI